MVQAFRMHMGGAKLGMAAMKVPPLPEQPNMMILCPT
jgi:hypothetical protein